VAVLDARLIIYSSIPSELLNVVGAESPHVLVRTPVTPDSLVSTLRGEADVLFLPMSFDDDHRTNMELSFPSKLTDYTETGRAILIWGPPYCSAVRWAREHGDVARVVEVPDDAALGAALHDLTVDASHRNRLGDEASKAGSSCFSCAAVTAIFYDALQRDERTSS
jgi:hypothetical protein